ncbi:hypothetical protein C8Q78DRAFT_1074099 [Trametes maxima]|nr:hypothetical protein C8Q78DRAFT_1074099 [Trametes maxima]
MCRRRQVRTIYSKCNHAITAADVDVACDSPRCIFSPNHPQTCTGDSCRRTCWQYRPAPQQYTEKKDQLCPYCLPGAC